MSDLVDPSKIEAIVGVRRDALTHYARAVSGEQRVYILHSQYCLDNETDLRDCFLSTALDRGLPLPLWRGFEDVPVLVSTLHGRLVPVNIVPKHQRPRCGSVSPESGVSCTLVFGHSHSHMGEHPMVPQGYSATRAAWTVSWV